MSSKDIPDFQSVCKSPESLNQWPGTGREKLNFVFGLKKLSRGFAHQSVQFLESEVDPNLWTTKRKK
jgi:hypothetical protein